MVQTNPVEKQQTIVIVKVTWLTDNITDTNLYRSITWPSISTEFR